MTRDIASILALPLEERLRLLEAIWDSLDEVPKVSEELRAELDQRLESYYANPSAVRPWDEVRAERFGK